MIGRYLVPLGLALAAPAALAQQQGGDDATQRRLEQQEKDLRELREEIRKLREEIQGRESSEKTANLEAEVDKFRRDLDTLQRKQFEMTQGEGQAATSGFAAESTKLDARLGTKGGLYAKPFLHRLNQNTALGGYLDLAYSDGQGTNRGFAQQHFNPFIFSDFADNLRVAAEIEFEFGGTDAEGGGGETHVEFATLDWTWSEALGLRAGAILVPLGKFNLIHDSPVNDLTDRPLVDQFVIPTTFTEPGFGIFGSTVPGGDWKLDYEGYLVQGFQGLVRDASSPTGFRSQIDDVEGLHEARPSLEQDNNNSVAGVGRVAISPFLGAEVGLSAHIGKYDDKGDDWLVVWAIDAIVQPQRFWPALAGLELQGEVAQAQIERDSLARASGVPGDLYGIYGQANYHFFFDSLKTTLPSVFREESTFTAVCRVDHVELDSNRQERVTLGINFRPIEDTVFKVDYQFNFEDWNRGAEPNDAILFSVATYF